jgi:hypothetical protein
VRSDDGKDGRLPLFSVVRELEKSGDGIRFSCMYAHGQRGAPSTGWVNTQAGMVCLGSDWTPPLPSEVHSLEGQENGNLIIFDWDDTLCPTTWIQELQQKPPPLFKSRAAECKEKMVPYGRLVCELLKEAKGMGTVCVVTLAERPWVDTALQGFFSAAAPEFAGIEVYYAREGAPTSVQEAFGQSADGEVYLDMKRRAMEAAVAEMAKRSLRSGAPWENIISVGDSIVEQLACQAVGRDSRAKGKVHYTKTVKLHESPNVATLSKQVRMLTKRLHTLVDQQGDRHWSVDDLAELK